MFIERLIGTILKYGGLLAISYLCIVFIYA